MARLYGGIEGGGTKFMCAVGSGPEDIRAEGRFPTTTPEETMQQVVAFFKQAEQVHGRLDSIGFASFGPLDPRPGSVTFGHILSTPKPGWSNADVLGMVAADFDIPVAFDTDVNGAALGEWRWGAARGLDTFIYLTIGTGIGGGVMANGELVHGLLHPEMGHVLLPRNPEVDPYEGFCLFHKNCFEGLAAGPAIENRWGQRAETLPPDHPAWELEAHYIALALSGYICVLSPQRIILGGGVSSQQQLLPMVHQKVLEILNGYIQSPLILNHIDEYIVPVALEGKAGILGAFVMAEQAL
ncbi:MAG: ROK family protein [Anaerolineales bacterium]|nr:ROK family protein [Anaerolineales bacterium]